MADYDVGVLVSVTDNELDNLEKRINNLKNKTVKVNIEADSSSIKGIESLLKNAAKTQTFKMRADTSGIKKEVSSVEVQFKRLASLQQRIGATKSKLSGLNAKDDISDIISLNKHLNNLTAEYNKLFSTSKQNLSSTQIAELKRQADVNTSSIKQTTSAYKELLGISKQVGNLSVKIKGLDASSSPKQISQLTTELKGLEITYQKLKSNLSGKLSAGQFNGLDSEVEKTKNRLAELDAKITDTKANLANGIKIKIENGDISNQISKVNNEFDNLENKTDSVVGSMSKLISAQKEFNSAINSRNNNKIISTYENYQNALKNASNQIKIVEREQKSAAKSQAQYINQQVEAQKLLNDKSNFNLSIDAWLKNNSRAAKSFAGTIGEIKSQIQSCDRVQLTNLQSQFKNIKLQVELAGKSGLSFPDRIKTQFTKFAGYFGGSTIVLATVQKITEMFQNVLDVDTQLTELYRVTDLTGQQYSDVYDKLTSSAQEYGAVLTDLISATADWSRAGFDADTAAGLAEVTSIYQHISDLDYNEASENLLTAYKGFEEQLTNDYAGDAVEAVSYISDILNELDNNYSVTAAGIGEAMKRSASALSVAGNTIQETAGMITGITEVTQDPEKAGNALKVVSMRLRGMKGELEELGEDTDDNVENLSKMQGQILNLTHGKVNIFGDDGEFKSTYEILQGIASVWKDLSSTDQATLLETVAGKHRANDVAAIFQNWKNVEAATKSATEATGSAAKENAKYTDSIQGHLDKLTSKWQEFSNNVLESDFLKSIVGSVTSVLSVLDSFVEKFGALPVLIGGVSIAMHALNSDFKIFSTSGEYLKKFEESIASFSRFDNVKNSFLNSVKVMNVSLADLKNAFDIGKSNNGFISGISSAFNAMKNTITNTDIQNIAKYNELISSGVTPQTAWYKSMQNSSNATKSLVESLNGSKVPLSRVISSIKTPLTRSDVADIEKYNSLIKDGVTPQTAWYKSMQNSSNAAQKLVASANGAAVGVQHLRTATISSSAAMIGAKVATIGLQVAITALEAAVTMGITLAISAAVQALMSWINHADELSDKVDDITTKYAQQKETLSDNKKTIDEISESYEKLSKGVNTVSNDNISLSTDEYKEYCDIVNQIADMFPELINGYDSQGNAVLSCAGNVEKLNEAYKKAAEGNYGDVLKEAGDIFEDFKNKSKDIEGGNLWGDSFLYNNGKMDKDSYNALKKVLEKNDGSDIGDKISEYITSDYNVSTEIAESLRKAGLKEKFTDTDASFIKRSIEENPKIAKQIVSDFESEMDSAVEDMRTAAESYIGKAFLDGDYSEISDNMQDVISSIVPNLDFDYFSQFDEVDELYKSLDKMMRSIDSLDSNGKETFEAYFDLQSKVNSGDCTVGEYISNLDKVNSVIDGLDVDDESKKALKLSFQLDDNDIEKEYDGFVNKLVDAGKDKKVAEKLVDGLTKTELKAAVQLEADGDIDLKNIDMGDLEKRIQEKAEYLDAMNFKFDIDAQTESLEKLNTAISQSMSGTGLNTESISNVEGMFESLNGYDPSKLFERTANGIRLNTDEFKKMNDEYKNNNIDDFNSKLSVLGNEYNRTREQLSNLTYGTEEYNTKANKLSDIETQINNIEQLAAQYEGLTSAYNEWQNAESAGSQRDMYESVISGFKNVKDEISRGWMDDGSIEFLELLTGKNLDGANVKKLKSEWDGLDKTIKGTSFSVKDFFTANDDGESTSTGVFNFLNAVDQKFKDSDIIKRDGKNNIIGFDFKVAGGDKAIADALGISEELVQIMVRAADDAGFVVSMDGTYQNLDVLKEKAQDAASSLKKMFKGTENEITTKFDLQTNDEDSIMKQYKSALDIWEGFKKNKNADGTVNMKVKGAEEAFTLVSTLQSMVDKLSEPVYMDVDASQVDKNLQTPLSKLQEYERLTQEEHQLNLKGTDTSEIQKSKDEILNYFEEIKKNQPEIAAKLGIDKLSREELEQKLNDGSLELDASLNLQVEMNDTLRDQVNVALYNAGLIDKEELEKRVDVNVYAENVDTSDVDNKTEETVEDSSEGSTEIEKTVDVDTKAGEVDTSDVKNKTEEAVKDESGESTDIEKSVDLEVKVDEYRELIQNLEDVNKDIEINVRINGLDKVEELNNKLDITSKVDGKVEDLTRFADAAKKLDGVSNNITKTVTGSLYGNLDKNKNLDSLQQFIDGAKELDGVKSSFVTVNANVDGNLDGNNNIDKLTYFAEGAKALEGVKSSSVSVNANLKANIGGFLGFNPDLNNIKKFADAAESLEGISDADVSVKANLEANIGGVLGYKPSLDNIERFAEGAKALEGIDSSDVTVGANLNANLGGIFGYNADLNNLDKFIDGAKKIESLTSSDVTVNATLNANTGGIFGYNADLNNLDKFTEGAKKLEDISDADVSVKANLDANIGGFLGSNFDLDNLSVFADGAKKLSDIDSSDVTVNATLNANTGGFLGYNPDLNNLSKFADAADKLNDISNSDVTVDATLNADIDGADINKLSPFVDGAKKLQDVNSKTVDVKATLTGDINGDTVNNLLAFADGAKKLQNVGDASVTVKANLEGKGLGNNIFGTNSTLSNLESFASGAKKLKGVGDVSSTVTANLEGKGVGDGWNGTNSTLSNLESFASGAKKLKGVGDVFSTVTANLKGEGISGWGSESKLDNLVKFADSAKKLNGVESKTVNVTANLNGNLGEKTTSISNLPSFASTAKTLQSVNSKDVTITANIEGGLTSENVSTLSNFGSVVSSLPSSANVTVTTSVDTGKINSAMTTLQSLSSSGLMQDYKSTVTVSTKVDSSEVKSYKPEKKTGTAKYKVDKSAIDKWKPDPKKGTVTYTPKVEALTDSQKNKRGTITYKAKIEGAGKVDGTAHVNGTAFVGGTVNKTTGKAFAQGNWGAKEDGVALMGELGQELVVRRGRWYTVGDNGAEFVDYKRGDIIFNADQTKELFEKGKITHGNGRGKALASGTAFVGGSTGSGGGLQPTGNSSKSNKTSTSKTSKSKSKSSSSSSDKDTKEEFDWIEVKIDRIERAISRADKTFNNTFIGWKARAKALNKELSKTKDEITVQNKAYKRYIKEANKYGKSLSKSWKNKVKNGTIDISTIKNDKLAEKIKNYQTWYNKAIDCKKAIDDLKESERELIKQRFDYIGTKRDYQIGIVDFRSSMIDEKASQREAQGYIVSSKYYEQQQKYQEYQAKKYDSIAKSKQKELEKNVKNKTIKVGGEEWYREIEAINELKLNAEQARTKIEELGRTIREQDWENFDYLQEKISQITEESEFLIELMSNDKLYDDNGQFTDKGQATAGLRVANYQAYMEQADKYADKIKEINEQIAADKNNKDLIDQRDTWVKSQRDAILSAEKEKDAIKSLVEDGINKELDSLNELIDKKKEALQSQKDLYDYQKKVKDQTKEIASLEKQMAAYAGDDSEETKAKLQELKVSLEDAKSDLQETEYDRYISDQQDMLDNLYDEYEEILNKRLDDVDALLQDMITATNDNKVTIKQTLETEVQGVGTTLSTSMNTIWTEASGVLSGVKTAVDGISSKIQEMLDDSDNTASKDIKKVSSASAGDTNDAQGKKDTSKNNSANTNKIQTIVGNVNTSSSGDGKAKVGDKVTYNTGKFHASSDGSGASGTAHQGEKVYITKVKSGAKYPYLIAKKKGDVSGALGWVKLNQLKGYAAGKKNLMSDELAWTQENGAESIVRPSDGAILTPLAKGDSVLNAVATGNIWSMANNPADFIKENLGVDSVAPSSSANGSNTYNQNLENVSFVFPNVKNYDQMLSAMQKDRNFENLIMSMTIDQVAGKSKLGKGKAVR